MEQDQHRLRIVEVKKGETWETSRFKDLNVNDTFRMFEPDDMTPVKVDRKTEFVVLQTPHIESGVWYVTF